MTNDSTTSTQTIASRVDEMAKRTRAIAAIHGLAHWLAEHPEVPVPTDAVIYAHGATATEVSDFAASHEVPVERSSSDPDSDTRWATLHLTRRAQGLNIDYIRIGH